jgi:predicted transcriptional regulator
MQSAEEKRQEAISKKNQDFKAEIGRLLGKYDMTKEEFANEVGISASTFYRRLRKPDEVTVGELTQIRFRFGEFNFAL